MENRLKSCCCCSCSCVGSGLLLLFVVVGVSNWSTAFIRLHCAFHNLTDFQLVKCSQNLYDQFVLECVWVCVGVCVCEKRKLYKNTILLATALGLSNPCFGGCYAACKTLQTFILWAWLLRFFVAHTHTHMCVYVCVCWA